MPDVAFGVKGLGLKGFEVFRRLILGFRMSGALRVLL